MRAHKLEIKYPGVRRNTRLVDYTNQMKKPKYLNQDFTLEDHLAPEVLKNIDQRFKPAIRRYLRSFGHPPSREAIETLSPYEIHSKAVDAIKRNKPVQEWKAAVSDLDLPMYLGTVPKALAALTGRELDDFAARHAIEDTEGLVDRLIAISTSALSAQTLANEATAREEDLLLQTIERHATGLYGAVEEGQRVICRNLYTHKDDDGAGGELVNRIDFVLSELLQRIEEFKSRERKSGRRRSPHIDWMRELYADLALKVAAPLTMQMEHQTKKTLMAGTFSNLQRSSANASKCPSVTRIFIRSTRDTFETQDKTPLESHLVVSLTNRNHSASR